MRDCEKTADAPTWVLYMFPGGKGSRLSCHLPDFSRSRELPGRLARLIVLLQQAMIEDAGLPTDLKGFRAAAEIAKAFDESRLVDPPIPETITTYLYKLCIDLKDPDSEGEPFPPLIERVKYRGARLLHPVEILFVGCSPIDTPRTGGSTRRHFPAIAVSA